MLDVDLKFETCFAKLFHTTHILQCCLNKKRVYMYFKKHVTIFRDKDAIKTYNNQESGKGS